MGKAQTKQLANKKPLINEEIKKEIRKCLKTNKQKKMDMQHAKI